MQCDKQLNWDAVITEEDKCELKKICKQLNSVPAIPISRFVGERNDQYNLVAFVDASIDIIGTVLYIQNCRTKDINFLLSQNKIVRKSL